VAVVADGKDLMNNIREASDNPSRALAKARTGISGLDEIMHGGLPAGRPTLVCGGPGCGKTILAMEFLVRGALEFGEPGLFVSFEESIEDLIQDFQPFGFDLAALVERKKLFISHVKLSRNEIVEAGEFTLDGLLLRLEHGIQQVGAKRVVIDTMETLFSCISNTENLRSEVARLFQWLKEKGVTCVITAERPSSQLTRYGFEEYASDCVLLLDHRISDQVSKRRLRIIKYRGSSHEKDEFPFLIDETGFSVLPISSVQLDHVVGMERVSTGFPDLDAMMGGQGYFRGSGILLSGTAGAGKSTLAATFAAAACQRGEKALFLSFEESPGQLVRNMNSVGLDLQSSVDKGLLYIKAHRPTLFGIEEHLVSILASANCFAPHVVVMDPITNFLSVGAAREVRSLLTRILDRLRANDVTMLFTNRTGETGNMEYTETGISSMMDTWIALRQSMSGHTRRCYLYVLKSRGMDHSREMREFIMSASGISLRAIPKADNGHNQQNEPLGSRRGEP
jgi:circadian clock protein KaiC